MKQIGGMRVVIANGGQGKSPKNHNIQAGGLFAGLLFVKCRGGRVRSIALVLKTRDSGNGSGGSNPSLYVIGSILLY